MTILHQIPLYAQYLTTVFKMAPNRDKENSLVQKGPKSKIPVSTVRPNLAAKWGRENLIAGANGRHPLIEIQPRAAGKVMNDGRSIPALKKEKIVTQISPQGSVIRVVRSKTTTTLGNIKITEALKDPARFVTLRKDEVSPLDWGLKVFQDSGPKCRREHITIRGDTMRQTHSQRSKSAERPSMGGLVPKPLTPTHVPTAQHNRVKNIKRSLKRPSSRELQNRSCQTEARADLAPLVPVDLALKGQSFSHIQNSISTDTNIRHLTISYERYIIKYLLCCGQRCSHLPNIGTPQRAIVVNWLVKVHNAQGPDSGNPQVLQVAVSHLDRMLALENILTDKVQLFAAVCYWLAQKQCGKPRSAGYIARHSADAFSSLDMKAAERYIVKKMGWPTIPIVADDFIPYLVLACSPKQPDLLNTAATFLCTVALLDKKFCCYTPDVIAVAAIVNCLLHLDVGMVKILEDNVVYIKAISHPRFNEIRDLMLRCVLVMKEDNCQFKEPYLQYSKPPLQVSVRLAESLVTKGMTAYRSKTLNIL